jgi:hypothetical protein
MTDAAVHEWVGLLANWITGRTPGAAPALAICGPLPNSGTACLHEHHCGSRIALGDDAGGVPISFVLMMAPCPR